MNEKQKHDLLFIQLIKTFENAAWIQMGKLKNPQTDKIEKDLAQAQYSIDMLDMLKVKTQGNLSDEESRLLDSILTNLKLNFVDELEKEKKAAEREVGKDEPSGESKEAKEQKSEDRR